MNEKEWLLLQLEAWKQAGVRNVYAALLESGILKKIADMQQEYTEHFSCAVVDLDEDGVIDRFEHLTQFI